MSASGSGYPPLKRSKTTSTTLPVVLPSSSTVSRVVSVSEFNLFTVADTSEQRGVDTPRYTLEEIATYLSVGYQKNVTSEELASKCIKSFLGDMDIEAEAFPGIETEANREMRHLTHVCVSTTSRPDVIVYSKKKDITITFVEVQSSPMKDTERKATFVAKDFLRMLRYVDSSITTLSVFCFPKRKVQQCIIEIEVKWDNFYIFTNLKRFPNLEDGLKRLKEVALKQCDHPALERPEENMMTLSPTDLNAFGVGYEQMSSATHIVVTNKQNVIKLLYCDSEASCIKDLIHNVEFKALSMQRFTLNVDPEPEGYVYTYFPYGSLKRIDAKKCLKELLAKIADELLKLRRMNISHNDVRLENICFDEQFKPCLIDFDRCCTLHKSRDKYFSGNGLSGCMYNLFNPVFSRVQLKEPDVTTDFMQLGWMAAFILDDNVETKDYHTRAWELTAEKGCVLVSEEIKRNKFIQELIVNKKFDRDLLRTCLPDDIKTVKDVIKS